MSDEDESQLMRWSLGDPATSDLVLTTPFHAFWCHRAAVSSLSPVLADCIRQREVESALAASSASDLAASSLAGLKLLEVPLPDWMLIYKLCTYSSVLQIPYTADVSVEGFAGVEDFADLFDLAHALQVQPAVYAAISLRLYTFELHAPARAESCWDVMLASMLFREHGQTPMATALLTSFVAVFDPCRQIPLPERLRFSLTTKEQMFQMVMWLLDNLAATRHPVDSTVLDFGAHMLLRRVHRTELVAEAMLRTSRVSADQLLLSASPGVPTPSSSDSGSSEDSYGARGGSFEVQTGAALDAAAETEAAALLV